MLGGFAATADAPADLSINLAAGSIYQLAAVDGTAWGSLGADAADILQQGLAAAQKITLTTAGLSSGQSRWALIEAAFSQVDEIPADDPNGGILPYLNTSNPAGPPWSGPNNSGATQNTRRLGAITVNVVYGNVATTGSEVPPNPTSGYVPLYLVDLSYNQTQINQSQIITAGPSVGTGVPSNYAQAPFLRGLVTGNSADIYSHHLGIAGHAPKVNLNTETQGALGLGQLPNAVAWASQLWTDTGTANAIAITLSPVPANLAALTGVPLQIKKIASPNTGAVTIAANALAATNATFPSTDNLISGALPGGGILTVVFDGTEFQLQSVVEPSPPPPGAMTRLTANLASAGTSVQFTADYVSVATALGGAAFVLPNFNETLNVASTGAGGMDTGAAPANGFVSVYAIYNPATKTVSILGTTQCQTTVYTGANMPAGYTASSLIAIWPTNASAQLVAGSIVDRSFIYGGAQINMLLNGNATSPTQISLSSAVPAGGRTVTGLFSANESSSVTNSSYSAFNSASISTMVQVQVWGITVGGLNAYASGLPLATSQKIWYYVGHSTISASMWVTGYSI